MGDCGDHDSNPDEIEKKISEMGKLHYTGKIKLEL